MSPEEAIQTIKDDALYSPAVAKFAIDSINILFSGKCVYKDDVIKAISEWWEDADDMKQLYSRIINLPSINKKENTCKNE